MQPADIIEGTDAGGVGFSNVRVTTLHSDIQVLHVLEYIYRVQLSMISFINCVYRFYTPNYSRPGSSLH